MLTLPALAIGADFNVNANDSYRCSMVTKTGYGHCLFDYLSVDIKESRSVPHFLIYLVMWVV